MAHCPYERLGDLSDCFETLRTWEDMREERPGVFYLKRQAFLHFHVDKAGRRWADVRDGTDWGSEVDIAEGASARSRRTFLALVKRRYRRTLEARRGGGKPR